MAYVESVSSFNPSASTIFSYPYVVSKNYNLVEAVKNDSNFDIDNYSYANALGESIESLKNMMRIIASKEASKEQNYIDTFISIIEQKDPEFAHQIKAYTMLGVGKSNLIDAIQKYRMGLITVGQDLKKELAKFKKNWSFFYNKIFMDAVSGASKIPISMTDTPETYIQNIIKSIENSAQANLDEPFKSKYGGFLDAIQSTLNSMTMKKFGEDFKTQIQDLGGNKYIQTKIKEHSTAGKSTKLDDLVSGYVSGIMNGLSAEQFLVTFGRETSTARFLTKLKSFTGLGKEGSQIAIKTDVLSMWSAELELAPPNQSQELDKIESSTEEALYNYIRTLEQIPQFVLHTSVKDLSTNKNYESGALAADITKTATLDTRLVPLKEICEKISLGKKDVESLIFAMANAGKYMIAYNQKDAILTGITSICAAYMFEDYVDTFSQIDFREGETNNALHLYFANGNYYTISDILSKTLDTLNVKGKNKVVAISFKPTQVDEFSDSSLDGLHGKERWEMVRYNTLIHSALSMRLNVRNLLNMLYPD